MLNDPLYKALASLRVDALERGMTELAITYGWSIMRRGEEIVFRDMELYRARHK